MGPSLKRRLKHQPCSCFHFDLFLLIRLERQRHTQRISTCWFLPWLAQSGSPPWVARISSHLHHHLLSPWHALAESRIKSQGIRTGKRHSSKEYRHPKWWLDSCIRHTYLSIFKNLFTYLLWDRETECWYLVHFPNARNSHGWTKLKPGAGTSIQLWHGGAGTQLHKHQLLLTGWALAETSSSSRTPAPLPCHRMQMNYTAHQSLAQMSASILAFP